jgi:hypothetical protein
VASREDLQVWLKEALEIKGGSARVPEACRVVWENHEPELRSSGTLFYTWQYDIRWAANRLRHRKIMKPVKISPAGVWELA